MLKPRSEWPNPDLSKEDLVKQMESAVESLPGNNYEFTQPIEMRFNELISGVRADLAIKVFGDDLDTIRQTAENVLQVVQSIDGSADARVEQVSGLPLLSVEPKRTELARYGLSVDSIQDLLASAIGGTDVGLIYEGDRRFNLVVRLPESIRSDIAMLGSLPVTLDSGEYVPLSEVATIKITDVPAQISRESGKRRVVVSSNVRGRDLGGFVSEVQAEVTEKVKLPSGYWIEYGGTYEQLQSASQRLSIVVPITLLLIFGLLVTVFSSFSPNRRSLRALLT